jgi:hypothetical protein
VTGSGTITLVAVHGAWADGSSWKDVILPLERQGSRVVAAPIPLTSLDDDAALKRAIGRTKEPLILAGHAYAGAVIAMTNTRNRLNLLRMLTVSSGCRMKASETLFHSMRPQNKSHYRQLSSGQFQ